MTVREMMSRDVVSVGREDTAAAAARLMSRHNVGSLPVCTDSGRLVGIVTDRDLVVRCVAAGKDPAATAVADVMTERVVAVSPDDTEQQASGVMAREQVRRVPVVSDGSLIGMMSLGDLAVREACKMEAAECLCDVCSCVRSR